MSFFTSAVERHCIALLVTQCNRGGPAGGCMFRPVVMLKPVNLSDVFVQACVSTFPPLAMLFVSLHLTKVSS